VSFGFGVGGRYLLGELGLGLRRDLPGSDESVDSIAGLKKEESGKGECEKGDGHGRRKRIQTHGFFQFRISIID